MARWIQAVLAIVVLAACQREAPPIAAPAADIPRSEAQIAATPDGRAGIAAGEFLGFYFVNTRSRPIFCRTNGVDISVFVDHFERAHIAEWQKTQALMQARGLDIEQVWQQIEPSLRSVVTGGIGEGSGAARANPVGTCHLIAETPDVAVASLTYAKVNPTLDRILLDAK